jgi:flagellar L-ring protein precursor FlgH
MNVQSWKLGVAFLALLLMLPVGKGEAQQQATSRPIRGSWLADRQQLKVGDIVTVVIDERVNARERTSRAATANRRQSLGLSASSPDFTPPITAGSFSTNSDAESRNLGEANRRGDLTSVFTVSIVSIEPSGLLQIQGERTVEIDGRTQDWELEGIVRPEDVSADNLVFSNRIANAVIRYKGKDIGPKKGILGKILSIFWP